MTNEEKYKTPEERWDAFMEYCHSHRDKIKGCTFESCRLRTTPTRACQFFWLAFEAEEEKPLPCPFCGGEAEVVRPESTDGELVRCKDCYSKSMLFGIKEEAIAAWNRRAK